MTKTTKQGFTLIEILIVVAIIAILASVVLVGLGPTQQAGRDARRISDLAETQNGLELYYNKCGYYPGIAASSTCGVYKAANTWTDMTTSLTGSNIGVMSVPTDPTGGKYYQYGSTNGTSYVIEATLENSNNSALSNYNPPSIQTGVATCTAPAFCRTL
jgi:general secretion pathway protein G